MASFIESTLPGRSYRSSRIDNHPVNIDLCTSLQKSRIRWYPDNDGIPSIKFAGCDIEWAFNSEPQRDAEYVRLLALCGVNVLLPAGDGEGGGLT